MSVDDSAWYIEVPLETDELALADDAVDVLQGTWADWEPHDGDLEVVLLEALAGMASALAQQASVATEEIFRTYGVKLVGVAYQAGTAATGTATFTLTDTASYTVPDGSEIDVDGVAFITVGDASNAVGASTIAAVPIQAVDVGLAGNGLGVSASRISALSFVSGVVVNGTTSGGTDAMTDEEYLGYLSRKLQLRADTLVTKRDHEFWALDWPGVGRAYAVNTTDRQVTIYIADADGEVIPTATKTAMTTDIANYRLVNTITTLADPTYTSIGVNYVATALPGYDITDLKVRIEAMLAAWLSPAGFAAPKFGDPGVSGNTWVGTNVVRRNSVIDRIADVEGVDWVNAVALTGGTIDGTTQKDTIDFTGTVTGGTYTITLDGQVTTAIPYSATAATVRTTLEALANTDPGDVLVTGGPGPTDMIVEHTGRYAFRSRTMTITSSVTGGGSVARTVSAAVVSGTGDVTMSGVIALPRYSAVTTNGVVNTAP
jgi:hypothetical protein